MAKNVLSPFLGIGPPDAASNPRRGSAKSYPSQFSQPHSAPVARASVLASVVPRLRRLDIGDDMSTHSKLPLLTLTLSSPSFLDSVVNDDFTEEPLYAIKTVGSSTIVQRADHHGEGNAKTTTADIKWPKAAPANGKGASDGILIQLRGARWKGGETLLRRGTLPGSPRKFNIPNYSHTLKWRRAGTSYWCSTTAVKGPIAIFEPSIASLPAKLVIFETLHDRYDARPMLAHHGVSFLLLDYLLITSLLLATDPQEWMLMKKHQGKDIIIIPPVDGDNGTVTIPKSAPSHISTSASQWRKVMFGEPLYRKRSSSRTSVSSLSTAADEDGPPSIPTPTNDITTLAYDQVRNFSASDASSVSGDENDHIFFSPVRTRPPSPSSESIFYPLTPSSAPSHTYLDPSFYGDSCILPVPPIPDWCKSPGETSTPSPGSQSPPEQIASSSKQLRVLPTVPISPLVPRPRSTPPQAVTSRRTDKGLSANPGTSGTLRRLPEQPDNALPRAALRRLPHPPSNLSPPEKAQSHVLPHGRSRSHSQSVLPTEKWHKQYGQRTLPLPPVSSGDDRQDFHRHMQKDAESELADWVHALTSPAPLQYPPVSLPGSSFDMPPPAYNSIEFHGPT